ncbi:MAG: cell envelope integrity protein TolA [Pseudomonadota bacterium]
MLTRKLRQNPGRVRAIVFAVLVHIVAITLLVIGFRWTTQPAPEEKVVQAVVVDETPQKEAEKRKQEEVRRTLEQEEAKKKAEADKRHQIELKRKQQEEQKLKEAEKKKRAVELERKKKEEEKFKQKHAEQSLKEQLLAEEKERVRAREEAAHSARASSEVNKYKALIRQRVSRSWSRPMGAVRGLQCVVKVRLTPSGDVLGATVVRSSGNAQFDRSVENAVYKSAPLPLPEDPALFDNFREIEFLFNPEE